MKRSHRATDSFVAQTLRDMLPALLLAAAFSLLYFVKGVQI